MKNTLRKLVLIAAVLMLVFGSPSRKAHAECGNSPFDVELYCEYEVDERSELKNRSFCIFWNFMTGEVYSCDY